MKKGFRRTLSGSDQTSMRIPGSVHCSTGALDPNRGRDRPPSTQLESCPIN
jgi:hypothetical protein